MGSKVSTDLSAPQEIIRWTNSPAMASFLLESIRYIGLLLTSVGALLVASCSAVVDANC